MRSPPLARLALLLTLAVAPALAAAPRLPGRPGRRGPAGPALTSAGRLPPGLHPLTEAGLARRFGTNAHRRRMLRDLAPVLADLRRAGAAEVLVGGSFVTRKPHPGDVDLLVRMGPQGPTYATLTPIRAQASARGIHLEPAGLEVMNLPNPMAATHPTFEELFQRTRDGTPVGMVLIALRGAATRPGLRPTDRR